MWAADLFLMDRYAHEGVRADRLAVAAERQRLPLELELLLKPELLLEPKLPLAPTRFLLQRNYNLLLQKASGL